MILNGAPRRIRTSGLLIRSSRMFCLRNIGLSSFNHSISTTYNSSPARMYLPTKPCNSQCLLTVFQVVPDKILTSNRFPHIYHFGTIVRLLRLMAISSHPPNSHGPRCKDMRDSKGILGQTLQGAFTW